MKHLTYLKSPKSEVMEMGFKLIQSLSGLNMVYQLLELAFGNLNTPLLTMMMDLLNPILNIYPDYQTGFQISQCIIQAISSPHQPAFTSEL